MATFIRSNRFLDYFAVLKSLNSIQNVSANLPRGPGPGPDLFSAKMMSCLFFFSFGRPFVFLHFHVSLIVLSGSLFIYFCDLNFEYNCNLNLKDFEFNQIQVMKYLIFYCNNNLAYINLASCICIRGIGSINQTEGRKHSQVVKYTDHLL